jgi:hypothetical protein
MISTRTAAFLTAGALVVGLAVGGAGTIVAQDAGPGSMTAADCVEHMGQYGYSMMDGSSGMMGQGTGMMGGAGMMGGSGMMGSDGITMPDWMLQHHGTTTPGSPR